MSEFRQSSGETTRGGGDADASVPPRTATVPAPPRVSALPTTMPPTSDLGQTTQAKPRRGLVWRLVRGIVLAGVALACVFAALIVTYRFVNPPASTLMLIQKAGGETITRTWVPIERMSPHLIRAVIMSEDAGFCRHFGVDWRELYEAFERSSDGVARGGSTISMQTAKNLFLWPSKSYVRKAVEIPLTLGMETVWPKKRMLEIYLNIAEWGPGIFGAEAAARHHFNKSASRLTEQEAALLAVSLPAPLIREPGNPSALLSRMAETIRGRMRIATRHTNCVLGEK